MGPHDYLKLVLALAFVLALMGVVAQLAKRGGLGTAMAGRGKRLAVLEARQIDARHKLVLVKCDEREHLLVLSPDDTRIIDNNVPPKATAS